MEFLEACRKIIGIDSSPSAGTLEVTKFVESLATSLGLHAELQTEAWNGVDQANVIVRPRALKNPADVPEGEFVLQTHLDTPDPGPYALWKKTGANPFNASIYQSPEGDRIYGLGSADVKLDFLCKLYAFAAVSNAVAAKSLSDSSNTWRVPPVLVGTYGEELGMPGAVKLIRKKKIRPSAMLVG